MPSTAIRSDTRLSRLPTPGVGLAFTATPRSTLNGTGGVAGAEGAAISKPSTFNIRFGPVCVSTQATEAWWPATTKRASSKYNSWEWGRSVG